MVYFSHPETKKSSTRREILGSLLAIKTLFIPRFSKILLPCDSLNTYRAIRWGSRTDDVHSVAAARDLYCDSIAAELIPVWTEREHYIIRESDQRGRFVEPNDYGTPPLIVTEANKMAIHLWGRPLEFDRAASAFNALPGMKFNSLWPQIGSSGINLFEQQD